LQRTGEIDFDEFHDALEQGHAAKAMGDAQKLMARADQDGSGILDFDEFHEAVVHHAGSDDGQTLDFQMLVKKKALADIRDAAAGRLFLLVFLLYPSLTNKIFEGLSCRRLGEDYSVLYVDYSIDCGSAEYTALAAVCFALVLIWPIGLPAGLFWSMWKEKDDILNEDEDTLQKFSFVLGKLDTELCSFLHTLQNRRFTNDAQLNASSTWR